MATNNFNSDYDNDAIVPLKTFNDGSGLARLDDLNISSYAFDGSIPHTTVNLITASITPGMQISLTGSALGEPFYKVISNTSTDTEVEDNATGQAIIEYLDSEKNIQTVTASVSDIFSVNYEDWSSKYLGTRGWYLSNDGNAIFSNVAVRGRIEATEGAIEGDLTLGGSLTASTNLGFVQISASGILGTTSSGRFHIDTTTGEIDLTGNITATSGQIKNLNIGPNYYPIIDINGVSTSSGHFIMRTSEYLDPVNFVNTRKLKNGEVFRLKGVISSSSCVYIDNYGGYSVVSASQTLNTEDFVVVSSSFTGSWPNNTYTYLCRYVWLLPGEIGIGFSPQYNFAGVTASSGSFNIGYLNFGIDYAHVDTDPLLGAYVTAQEGIIFENYRTGLVPDYIDLSGRFRLGGGKFNFDGSNLSVIGQINATSGSISGDLKLGGSLTASTNTGQLIISSSGIFGSTNNGLFHLDNIDGEITFTGNINARGGSLKYLTIGNNFYPVLSIVGQPSSSVNTNAGFIDSSNIIMNVFQERLTPVGATFDPAAGFKYPKEFTNGQSDGTAIKRYLAQGDYFILSNVSPSGSVTTRILTFSGGQFVTSSALVYNQVKPMKDLIEGTYEVLTASVGLTTAVESGSVTVFDRYYCRKYQITYPSLVDFSLMSASSGSFTSGFSFIGEYTSLNGSEVTRIDGLVLESVRPGTTWYDYIPDFLDLSGRFRLGYGSIIRNTSRLIAEGDLKNKQEVYSVSSSVFTLPTGSGGSEDSIDEKYSNYIFEINPPGASCNVKIFTTLFADRDYFDFINIKAGASVTFTISGTSLQAPNDSWVNSYQSKKVLSGQWSSARIQKRSASSWFLTGDLS